MTENNELEKPLKQEKIESNIDDRMLRYNLKGMKGWLKFLGVMTLIYGIGTALTLIGIVIAWLPIWMGVLLIQAASKADYYANYGDTRSIAEFTGKIKTYFVIQGILILITLIGMIVSLMVFGIGMFAAIFSNL